MLKHAVHILFCSCALLASENGQPAVATPTPASTLAAPAPGLTLTLKSASVSSGDEILFSEVIELPTTPTLPVWYQTPISRAAVPGQMRTVYAAEILAALRKAGVTETINLTGAGDTRVTALSQVIPAADIDAVVQEAARGAFSSDSDLEVSTEIISQQALTPIRPGAYELSVDIPETGLRPTQQSVRVRVSQKGRRVADAGVNIRVRLTGTVTVASERLQTGAVLADADLKTIRRELSSLDLSLRSNTAELIGMRVKQSIGAGQIVHAKLLAAPLVIKRGDAVSVIVRRGSLELHSHGEARTDAALNDSVRVFIPDSNADVVGRASGPREISLDEPRSRAGR